jgi:hypothetical protein
MEPRSEVCCILSAAPTVDLLHASQCIFTVITHLPARQRSAFNVQSSGGASYDTCTMRLSVSALF